MDAKSPVLLTFVAPANASVVDTILFVCPEGAEYEVVEANEAHLTAGSDGGSVVADLKKAASGTAITSGTSVLASTFNLKSTASTPVRKTAGNGGLVSSASTRRIASGQQLGIDFTGTMTAVVGLCLQVTLKLVRAGVQR